ncbi:endonuclease/exonuclease/phosphatase family protein [Akkermansia muciniphila]|uniref:endonuclease/exonuclease/phosphatase family protein n=1 Tax=Akkermansia muciniphila TaxID=239935 RepID=UPI003CCFD126
MHRKQLQYLFDTLREVGTQHGELPIIMAGNFSVSPQSPIFSKLSSDFQDCFKLKGAGYGATQPVNFPLLRLDRVFCTPPLKPERASTVLIPDTIRRSIVADIAIP